MAPAQILRMQIEIKTHRASLAADRIRFGWYDDIGGMWYKILELYILIDVYQGVFVYLRWFFKNYPYDAGFPFAGLNTV